VLRKLSKKFSVAVVKQVENCQEILILRIKCLLDVFDKLVEETAKIDQNVLEIAYHHKDFQRFMITPGKR
jgi:hypothetical protein